MQILVEKHYAEMSNVHKFYIDRIIRIFPQVILYVVLTLALVKLGGVNNKQLEAVYLSQTSAIGVLQHILVLPLGYYMFLNISSGFLVPQAWTLGLECTFYLIFPFIRKKKEIFICGSLFIFLLAYMGIINTDWFGYRLLPGTLFVFLVGAVIAEKGKYSKIVAGIIVLISIILWMNIFTHSEYNLPYNKEVLLGIIIGIPMLFLTKNIKQSKIDKLLGNLSYGIYLNHFFIMYLMPETPKFLIQRVVYIGLSIVLAYLSYKFFEAPIMQWRYRIRNNKKDELQKEH